MTADKQTFSFNELLRRHEPRIDPDKATWVYYPGCYYFLSSDHPREAVLRWLDLARGYAGVKPLPSRVQGTLTGSEPIFVSLGSSNMAFLRAGEQLERLSDGVADAGKAAMAAYHWFLASLWRAVRLTLSVLFFAFLVKGAFPVIVQMAVSADPGGRVTELAKWGTYANDVMLALHIAFSAFTIGVFVSALLDSRRKTRAFNDLWQHHLPQATGEATQNASSPG